MRFFLPNLSQFLQNILMKQNSWKYHTVSCCKKRRGRVADRFQTHTHTLIHCTKSLFFWVKRVRSERIFSINWAPFFYRQEKNKKKSDSRGAASLGRSPKKRARQPTCTPQLNESLYKVEMCLFKLGYRQFWASTERLFLLARKE